MKLPKINNQKGDTIIEVLISIAVISAILSAAYVTASRNLTTTRATQERGEAIKLAEGQLERLRVSSISNSDIFTGASQFCLDAGLVKRAVTEPQCQQGRYHHTINRNSTNSFVINVQWDRVGGGGVENLDIAYRIYE